MKAIQQYLCCAAAVCLLTGCAYVEEDIAPGSAEESVQTDAVVEPEDESAALPSETLLPEVTSSTQELQTDPPEAESPTTEPETAPPETESPTPEPETAPPETAAPAYGEADLRVAADRFGTVRLWEYADYDGNGTKEAFFLTTVNDGYDDNAIDSVYFIDSTGAVTVMLSGDGRACYESNDGHRRICRGKQFFWTDCGAYGSGWSTLLYSVRDNVPYALDVADSLQGFYQSGDTFYTTLSDFSQGFHDYINTELIYDEAAQQFRIGDAVDVNMQ